MTILERVYPAYLTDSQDMILGEIHEVSDETMNSIDQLEDILVRVILKMNITKNYMIFIMNRSEVVEQAYIYVYNMERIK